LAVQIGLVVAVERWFPAVAQPQFGQKVTRLGRRLAGAPGRPLVLFMGTSRGLNGVKPDELPDGPAAPVFFNFAHAGAGPYHQVLLLRRLLGRGVRPTHLFYGARPALLVSDGGDRALLTDRFLSWQDWRAMRRYWPDAGARRGWLRESVVPCLMYRQEVLENLLPWTQPKWCRYRFIPWTHIDGGGFFAYGLGLEHVLPAQYDKALRHARSEYYGLLQTFRISPVADRSVRDFLALCRKRGIG